MEDRKRSTEEMNTEQFKRLRPDEILGVQDDYRKLTTRLLMNRLQFSKVIGKGGQTISHIRSTCGAIVKGNHVDEESRLVVISGTLPQVIDAFEIIVELMHQAYTQNIQMQMHSLHPIEPFSIQMLLEHAKAGKVVGVKGSMIQSLKTRTGVSNIKLLKDPKDFSGVLLRTVLIEGPLLNIRRAHLAVSELFIDPAVLQTEMAGRSFGSSASLPVPSHSLLPSSSAAHSTSSRFSNPLPLQSLTSVGVQPETVRQLIEMKQYLSRHFNLDLSIFSETDEAAAAAAAQNAPPSFSPYLFGAGGGGAAGGSGVGVSGGSGSTQPKAHPPTDLVIDVPRNEVGAIIGRGGSILRELSTEFGGLRVFVDRDTMPGGGETAPPFRQVVVVGALAPEADPSLSSRIQARIEALLAAHKLELESKAASSSGGEEMSEM